MVVELGRRLRPTIWSVIAVASIPSAHTTQTSSQSDLLQSWDLFWWDNGYLISYDILYITPIFQVQAKKHRRENTIIEPLHFLAHISAILCLVLFVLCLYCANCGLWANSCEHNYCVVDRAAHFPVSCLLFQILISAFQRALSSQALSEIKLFTILYSKTKGRGWCI